MNDETPPWLHMVLEQFNGRFASLENQLVRQHEAMHSELSTVRILAADIPVLAERVGVQNVRVGKLEARMDDLDAACAREALFDARAKGERDGERRAYGRMLRPLVAVARWVSKDGIVLKIFSGGATVLLAAMTAKVWGWV